ncbi:protein FAM204A [Syngnathoides biaculeatus]|uniref:protein FAM204A n=1 Tax=Syngnathoides biaculeatus TaxID=300417 RepID=UPI002ADDD989|nr:protein FAM204A [Syngnathoides biaculeatus]
MFTRKCELFNTAAVEIWILSQIRPVLCRSWNNVNNFYRTFIIMYSGLLPKGLTEEDLSPDDQEEEREHEVGEEYTENQVFKTPTVIDATNAPGTCNLPGISQETWQKFNELRKKKEETKMTKIPTKRRRKRRPCKKATEGEMPTETSLVRQEELENHWNGLKQYFGVNDRFHPPACSSTSPKSGLEKSIERAIAEGDTAKAEEMSDRLATRELAVKIAEATDCRDFVRRKREEDALRAAKKRKKQIAWGFEAKKRWETKSNMGYM